MNYNQLSRALLSLVDLVETLRGPEGCPWDAKQTNVTVKSYMLEEAYEVLDAIEKSSPPNVCQELGDLLFHIIFLARLAEEKKEFDIIEVIEKITEKMIRRHPHVFGDAKVNNTEEVIDNWAKIKQEEQADMGNVPSYLGGIPKALPALMRAHRLSERHFKYTQNPPAPDEVRDQTLKSLERLEEAIKDRDKDRFGREMGGCLFTLANLARIWGFNSEHLLRVSNESFVAGHEMSDTDQGPLNE
jgi:MazG family protein